MSSRLEAGEALRAGLSRRSSRMKSSSRAKDSWAAFPAATDEAKEHPETGSTCGSDQIRKRYSAVARSQNGLAGGRERLTWYLIDPIGSNRAIMPEIPLPVPIPRRVGQMVLGRDGFEGMAKRRRERHR